ncbi:MAG: FecCD family ABC transporter permease [Acidimicrobiia bacterium]
MSPAAPAGADRDRPDDPDPPAGRTGATAARAAARHPTRLAPGSLVAAAAGVGVSVAVATAFGAVGVAPLDALAVLADRLPGVNAGHDVSPTVAAIVVDVRFPRVLLAALVGAVLATAGGAYQATFRNPLADPYLLGVASGAGLGVTVALTETGADLGATGLGVTAAAFVGALGAVGLAYALGTSAGGRSGPSLILAGVAVSALCGALQALLLQRDDEAVRDVYSWLLGRFNAAGWDELGDLAPFAAVALVVLLATARRLDLLALGDDEARSLGVDPGRLRLLVVVTATLATAAAVAVGGLIGFVGIVVPHALRLRVGPSYRRILPLAVAGGAAFLCLADLGARTLLAPAEVPIGVLTAVAGAPFFLILLRTSRVRGA